MVGKLQCFIYICSTKPTCMSPNIFSSSLVETTYIFHDKRFASPEKFLVNPTCKFRAT